MKLNFYKYEGAGNDFVLVDGRQRGQAELTQAQIRSICHRRFGVGADGLMILGAAPGYDFSMRYFNADGGESTMCGNGGRCIVRFADDLGIGGRPTKRFVAIDGAHCATINANDTISLAMIDVETIECRHEGYFVDTGSPHLVLLNKPFDLEQARHLRNEHNANVNYVEVIGDGQLNIRTFERGVEAETWACGTGATAAAIVVSTVVDPLRNDFTLNALGGTLRVDFSRQADTIREIRLTGPAKKVFEGVLQI